MALPEPKCGASPTIATGGMASPGSTTSSPNCDSMEGKSTTKTTGEKSKKKE
jgi:hypothetical protein